MGTGTGRNGLKNLPYKVLDLVEIDPDPEFMVPNTASFGALARNP